MWFNLLFLSFAVQLFSSGALASKANLPCTTEAFAKILPAGSNILYAIPNGPNATFGFANDTAYPINATNLPAFCAIHVNVSSSPVSSFRFGLWLPTEWNERFLAVGNSGFAGGINYLDMGPGLGYGFSVMSTDTGHNSTNGDGSWALNNPEGRTDWGFRAMHTSIVMSKEIINTYYGINPKFSYYSGCSTGGRQGLKDIQLFPDDFDGVLAGSPAWWVSHLQPWTLKLGAYNLPVDSPGHIPATLFPVISAEVFKQCDPADGLTDGIISDPSKCDFYPEALLCSPTLTTNCLTAPQLDTIAQIYHDYVETNQTFVFPHLELGSEGQWPVLINGTTAPNTLGTDYVQFFLLNDPTWPYTDFDFSIVQLAEQLNPGNATADDFNMTAFQAHGGKLIMTHGLSDGLIATGSSRYFYNHVYRTLAPAGIPLDPWFRLFIVPGMQHCQTSVNDAPWYFAGAQQASVLGSGVHSVPGFEDPQHDILLALMAWVENGVEPNSIVATKFVNETVEMGVARQRTLCPYPGQAVYMGGNVNASQSWGCREIDPGFAGFPLPA